MARLQEPSEKKVLKIKSKNGDDPDGEDCGEQMEVAMYDLANILKNKQLIQILDDIRAKEYGKMVNDAKNTKDNKKMTPKSSLLSPKKKKKVQKPAAKPDKNSDIDWFQNHLQTTESDEEQLQALKEHMHHIEKMENKVSTFFTNELDTLSYQEFSSILDDHNIRDKIAIRLLEEDAVKSRKRLIQNHESIKEVSRYVSNADKDLFIKLKDNAMTLDQFKARINERKLEFKYVVLDDLKLKLPAKFFEDGDLDDKSHCQREKQRKKRTKSGLKAREQFFFKAVNRGRTRDHLSYQCLPESMSLDYNQAELTEKVPITKLQHVFKLKKFKEFEDSQLNQKEEVIDKEKIKKDENVQKLKKQLGLSLWLHKQLELNQMPFDSSKVQQQDKLGEYFKLKDNYKPDLLKNKNRSKTKNEEKKGGGGAMEDYINAYKMRMQELNDRRCQMLFLKRLENDGARIGITEKDRALLKNYDKDEEDIAEQNLKLAIQEDTHTTEKDYEDQILKEAEAEEEQRKALNLQAKKRNPESLVEKLRLKRMKAACSETKAVAVNFESINPFQKSKLPPSQPIKKQTKKVEKLLQEPEIQGKNEKSTGIFEVEQIEEITVDDEKQEKSKVDIQSQNESQRNVQTVEKQESVYRQKIENCQNQEIKNPESPKQENQQIPELESRTRSVVAHSIKSVTEVNTDKKESEVQQLSNPLRIQPTEFVTAINFNQNEQSDKMFLRQSYNMESEKKSNPIVIPQINLTKFNQAANIDTSEILKKYNLSNKQKQNMSQSQTHFFRARSRNNPALHSSAGTSQCYSTYDNQQSIINQNENGSSTFQSITLSNNFKSFATQYGIPFVQQQTTTKPNFYQALNETDNSFKQFKLLNQSELLTEASPQKYTRNIQSSNQSQRRLIQSSAENRRIVKKNLLFNSQMSGNQLKKEIKPRFQTIEIAPKNVQQRLKTALDLQKQRKEHFNNLIGKDGSKKPQTNTLFQNLGQSDFQSIRNECILNNDYKSMAVVSRLQKSNNASQMSWAMLPDRSHHQSNLEVFKFTNLLETSTKSNTFTQQSVIPQICNSIPNNKFLPVKNFVKEKLTKQAGLAPAKENSETSLYMKLKKYEQSKDFKIQQVSQPRQSETNTVDSVQLTSNKFRESNAARSKTESKDATPKESNKSNKEEGLSRKSKQIQIFNIQNQESEDQQSFDRSEKSLKQSKKETPKSSGRPSVKIQRKGSKKYLHVETAKNNENQVNENFTTQYLQVGEAAHENKNLRRSSAGIQSELSDATGYFRHLSTLNDQEAIRNQSSHQFLAGMQDEPGSAVALHRTSTE